MSNNTIPPLDLALKEQLNQLNQFGETMMNRINDRVDRLLERLTPTTEGNNPGVINATPLGGVEVQGDNQPPDRGIDNPVGRLPLQPQPGPQPLLGEGEAALREAPRANPPPVTPPAAFQTPQRVPNLQDQARFRAPPLNPEQGFEAQASYQPPRRYRPQITDDNNPEYSCPQRILDFDADSDDDSLFAAHIVNAPRTKFKAPSLEKYNGQGDPEDHVMNYKTAMRLLGATDPLMCLAFPTTLKGHARDWYNNLPRGSIISFRNLAVLFCNQFAAGKKRKRDATCLLSVAQRNNERLRDYIQRFNNERLDVEGCTDDVAKVAFIAGLDKERNRELMRTYLLHPPPNFDTTMALAKDEMLVKEFLGTSGIEKKNNQGKPTGRGREEDVSKRAMYNRPPPRKSPPPLMRRPSPPRARRPSPPPVRYTMLNSPGEEVLEYIKERGHEIAPPARIRSLPNQRRGGHLYCRYHRDTGHHTDDCRQLRDEIEKLIAKGHLQRFVARDKPQKEKEDQGPKEQPRTEERRQPPPDPLTRVIHTIAGGPAAGGASRSGLKKYARQVHQVSGDSNPVKYSDPITFSDPDMEGVNFPHSDAIVIKANLGGMEVRRLLIDDGSSCDIIFLEAFMKMGIKTSALKECVGGLVGFTGHEAPIIGILTLPMTLGEWPRAATEMIDFLIMDLPSAYNGILGRTSLSAIRIVI